MVVLLLAESDVGVHEYKVRRKTATADELLYPQQQPQTEGREDGGAQTDADNEEGKRKKKLSVIDRHSLQL